MNEERGALDMDLLEELLCHLDNTEEQGGFLVFLPGVEGVKCEPSVTLCVKCVGGALDMELLEELLCHLDNTWRSTGLYWCFSQVWRGDV